jgi:hypothetical protein
MRRSPSTCPVTTRERGCRSTPNASLSAIGTREVILVTQSLGGFTAPLVCAKAQVRMLAFVNAMILAPDETAGEWWANTGCEEASRPRTAAATARTSISPPISCTTFRLTW